MGADVFWSDARRKLSAGLLQRVEGCRGYRQDRQDQYAGGSGRRTSGVQHPRRLAARHAARKAGPGSDPAGRRAEHERAIDRDTGLAGAWRGAGHGQRRLWLGAGARAGALGADRAGRTRVQRPVRAAGDELHQVSDCIAGASERRWSPCRGSAHFCGTRGYRTPTRRWCGR